MCEGAARGRRQRSQLHADSDLAQIGHAAAPRQPAEAQAHLAWGE